MSTLAHKRVACAVLLRSVLQKQYPRLVAAAPSVLMLPALVRLDVTPADDRLRVDVDPEAAADVVAPLLADTFGDLVAGLREGGLLGIDVVCRDRILASLNVDSAAEVGGIGGAWNRSRLPS